MPVYVYKHPQTHKLIEVVQSMNDKHEYVDDKGVKYERVFLNPLTAVDTQMDPFNKQDFLRRTKKSGMTLGEMMDESAALSEKRAQVTGVDPIKQKVFDSYKQRTGKKHPEDKPKKVETKDYVIEL